MTDLDVLLLQVKFSELTLDMFRMLQTLEREPQEDLTNQIYDASPAPGRTPFVSGIVVILSRSMCVSLSVCLPGPTWYIVSRQTTVMY